MKVTSKGQVTIPQELRKRHGIGANAEVEFVEEESKLVLKVVRPGLGLADRLRGKGDVGMTTDEILSLTRAE